MNISQNVYEAIKAVSSLPCLYPAGAIVAHEGDRCTMVGLLTEGTIKLLHYSYFGDETGLGRLTKGDVFADIIVHEPTAVYPATLVAETNASVVYLDRASLDGLIASNRAFRSWYFAHMAHKFAALNQRLKILSQPSLRKRIYYWLETSADTTGTAAFESVTQLAETLNVTRPALSRELHLMKGQGLIHLGKNELRIGRL